MPTSQPAASPLGILLLVAAIFLVVKSPKKLQTLGRMVIAFVVTVLLFIVPGAILRMGDPQAWGRIGGLGGLLIAVIAGWWHMRSVTRASTETSGQATPKGLASVGAVAPQRHPYATGRLVGLP
jgi:succinate-acetate transporter protein